jgi:hypothetical protein
MAGGSGVAPSPVAPPPPRPNPKTKAPPNETPSPSPQRGQPDTDQGDEDDDVIDLAEHEVRVVRSGNKPTNLPPAEPRIDRDADERRKPKPTPVSKLAMPSPKAHRGPEPRIPDRDPEAEHPAPPVPKAPDSEPQTESPAETDDDSDPLGTLANDDRSPMPMVVDPALGVNPSIDLNSPSDPPADLPQGTDIQDDAHAAVAAAAPAVAGSAREARQARQARQAKLQGLQTQSMGFQFRQIAIPLLLVMAIMLAAAAGMVSFLGSGYDPATDGENLLLEHGRLFSTIAGGLALALIVGALVFRWEIRRAQSQERQNDTGRRSRRR